MSAPYCGMRAVLKAFQAKFDGSDLETLLDGGKLWPWGTPQGIELPYVTVTPDDVAVEYTMGSGTTRMETIPVSFSVWLSLDTFTTVNVLETTMNYYEALQALFDDCALDMSADGWSLLRMGRTGYFIGPDDDKGWQIRADYELLIEEV